MASTATRSRRLPSSASRWLAFAKAADRGLALQLAVLGLAAAAIWLAFDRAGLDRRLTALAYDPAARGFPLQHSRVLEVALHDWLKWSMAACWAFCLASPPLRRGALYMALAAAAVLLLRATSLYSCPWDLPQYGGGSLARAALAAAWIIGLAAGAIQVARGAHFASHVLWTAWVAWTVTLAAARLAPPRA
ncbi:MAG TPA: hypothetical protein VH600_19680 [Burkholderiales bacterium]|jgi:membrane-associated PAP2 superfamily phosphatase